jgi:hypothetical protein
MIEGWSQVFSGMINHWKKDSTILSGNGRMHIIGIEETNRNKFIGIIQLRNEFDINFPFLYKTKKLSTFSKCVDDLENWWHKLIEEEAIENWNR